MTKIINIHTGKERVVQPPKPIECSICKAEYSKDEGGIEGSFGIMPVQFCPFCFSNLMDMAQQLLGVKRDE